MQEMLEKKKILITPTSSRSTTETVNGYKFVIPYSSLERKGFGNYTATETFTVGGYQWEIRFYPDGKLEDDKSTYVSVFIVLTSEGTDVRTLFELTLLDQSGKENHKVHSHSGRCPHTLKGLGSSMGYTRFFRRALLETSDFLKDGCLNFNCTVGVVTTIDCSRLHSIQVPNSYIGSDFGMLQEGSDVVFDVCGEKFQEGSDVVFGADDWSALPSGLLNLILDECNEFDVANKIRCSAVCQWWRLVVMKELCNHPCVQLPMLWVPRNGWISSLNAASHYFEDHYMELNIDKEWDCRGSAYGWLFLVNQHMIPKLLNPFTGCEILLPSLATVPCPLQDEFSNFSLVPSPRSIFPSLIEKAVHRRCGLDEWMVHKAIFSSNPSCWEHKSIIILVIYGVRHSDRVDWVPTWLAHLTLGDKVWMIVKGMDTHPIPRGKKRFDMDMFTSPFISRTVCFRDAIFSLEKVLLLDSVGNIATLDLKTNTLSCDYPGVDKDRCSGLYSFMDNIEFQFLVKVDGDLMVILLDDVSRSDGSVIGLRLLKFEKSTNEWVELEDLCGDAIFVGLNSSIHLPKASEHPGCEADSIYFTNDSVGDNKRLRAYARYTLPRFPRLYMGVFDMKHKSLRPLYIIGDVPEIPVSIWITPLLIFHPKSESPKNQSPSVQEGSNIDKMPSNPPLYN